MYVCVYVCETVKCFRYNHFIENVLLTAECAGERILKISQYLTTLM